MRLLLPFAVICLALLTGCSRALVTTQVSSGGKFTRTISLTGQEKKENQPATGDTLDDDFVMPSGEGWTTHNDKKDNLLTASFERTFAAGTPVNGDLTIKGEQGKPILINQVAVSRLAPNRFEYKETLRWTGPSPEDLQIKPEDLNKLKALLPAPLATDANARAVSQKMQELSMPMLFGPGDPMLIVGFLHPELAERRVSQKIGGMMLKALEEQFGDKMTLAQRRDVTLKLIQSQLAQSKQTAPDPSGNSQPGKSSALTPLMFVVKTPGKIVSSNGDLDELRGEVFWALYPPAATIKPVVMTAVVEVDAP